MQEDKISMVKANVKVVAQLYIKIVGLALENYTIIRRMY